MASKQPVITFNASVSSVKTLADFGIRITLDLPEDAIKEAAMLMQCKVDGIPLKINIMADIEKEKKNDEQTKIKQSH